MTDKPIATLQQQVGYPEYRLLDNETTLHPLEAWDPPPGNRAFSAQELYEIFNKHCIAFVGDSLQRRAADTLHAIIEHRNTSSQNYTFSYFWKPRDGHGHYTRMIGAEPPRTSPRGFYKKKCEPGTIDSVWAPRYEGLLRYKYDKEYTIIVTGIGAWVNSDYSPNEVMRKVNQSIHHIHKVVPKSTIVIWRSGTWNLGSPWNYVRSNEMVTSKSNYLMHCSNQAAKETINNINADNLFYIDWAKEILPYSFSQRIPTNMMAEDDDHSAWHVGPKARALLLQMIASDVAAHHPTRQVKAFNVETFSGEGKVFLQGLPGTYLVVIALIVMRKFSRQRSKGTMHYVTPSRLDQPV
eukprot:scaffold1527_cov107-Cylindrotheca_fusiformis.AAC.2